MQNTKNIYLVIGIALLIVAVAVAIYFWWQKSHEPEKDINSGLASLGNKPAESQVNTSINTIKNNMHLITIKTNYGEIKIETYDVDAPKTVENFITLAEKGFYDSLIFHRVIKGFMIQGGDPNCNPSTSSGTCGAGGPGYTFSDELNSATDSYKAGYKKGIVAMANAGPDTNGSQFFIMLENYPLPNNYTIFGKVVKGQEVVDAIGSVQTGANDKPLKPVIMEKVTVETVETKS